MKLLVDAIDEQLPQTQCGECSYAGCRPYAEAIVKGERIDRCPPGGLPVLKKLALLIEQDPRPYEDALLAKQRLPSKAVIDEDHCIGCTKCIQVCPVDAIVGSAKKMHTIIANECTGCELCVPACPVDCIDLVSLEKAAFDKDKARRRFAARHERLVAAEAEKRKRYKQRRYQSLVQGALERHKQKMASDYDQSS